MGVFNVRRCKSDLLHFFLSDLTPLFKSGKSDKVDLDVVNHCQCQTKAIIHII